MSEAAPSEAARRAIALLMPYTPFAEAIVKRQAERAGLDLRTLDWRELQQVGPMIVKAAAVFVDPGALGELRRHLVP